MLGKFGCMNWKVALRKEISALSVLEVWFVLFILYTEYVALHSSFRGKSSVFTKWHEESLGSAALRNTAVIKWNPFSNK
jgi:hypothetical protein